MKSFFEEFTDTNIIFLNSIIPILNEMREKKDHSKKTIERHLKKFNFHILDIEYEKSNEESTKTVVSKNGIKMTFINQEIIHVKDNFKNIWSFKSLSDQNGMHTTYELYKFHHYQRLTLSKNDIRYIGDNFININNMVSLNYINKKYKINEEDIYILGNDHTILDSLTLLFDFSPITAFNFLLKDQPIPEDIKDLFNLKYDFILNHRSNYLSIDFNKNILEEKNSNKNILKRIFKLN